MMPFDFTGRIAGSKSIFNRALIAKSFFEELIIEGYSDCEDVKNLRNCLRSLQLGEDKFWCGEGGTTFRFWSLRVSRETGEFRIKVSPQLMKRPQTEIFEILRQLGVEATLLSQDEILIKSKGWQHNGSGEYSLNVDGDVSSQFASSVLLSSWNLQHNLTIHLSHSHVSSSYLELTISNLQDLGMKIDFDRTGRKIWIAKEQRIKINKFKVESDLSSIFSIASIAAISGKAIIRDFPFDSKQPDLQFLKIFEMMGIEMKREDTRLIVKMTRELKPVNVDLSQAPDLFPVLAVLTCFADGKSILAGAGQLIHKESNRIHMVSELLNCMSIEHAVRSDGLEIYGGRRPPMLQHISFDPRPDHRMFMAASLFWFSGYNIDILHPEVLNKSFPEFVEICGLKKYASF